MTERVVPYLIRMLAPPAGGDHFAIGGAPESFHAVQRFHELLALFQRQAEQAGGQAVGHTGVRSQHAHAVKVGGGPEGGRVDEVVVAHTIDKIVALIVAAGDEGEVTHFDSGHRGGAAGVDVRSVPRVFHTADPLGAVGLGADGPQVATHADESAGQAAGLGGLGDHLHGVAFAHAAHIQGHLRVGQKDRSGGVVDDEGNWTVNSDANVEAVEFAVDLYKKGYTNPNPATQTRYDLQDMFGAGKLAMVIAPNSLPTYIADKGYTNVNYAVADIPHNEGKTSSSVGVMDRIMAFKDDSAPDQAARNEAIGKFLTFFYDPENYVGWVSMEDFLPAVNSAVAALVEANPSFEAWLNVLDGCKFYPTAKAEWIDVKQGAAAVEQSALTGGDVKTLLDELQAKITK